VEPATQQRPIANWGARDTRSEIMIKDSKKLERSGSLVLKGHCPRETKWIEFVLLCRTQTNKAIRAVEAGAVLFLSTAGNPVQSNRLGSWQLTKLFSAEGHTEPSGQHSFPAQDLPSEPGHSTDSNGRQPLAAEFLVGGWYLRFFGNSQA
jgi:hypothetical protein